MKRVIVILICALLLLCGCVAEDLQSSQGDTEEGAENISNVSSHEPVAELSEDTTDSAESESGIGELSEDSYPDENNQSGSENTEMIGAPYVDTWEELTELQSSFVQDANVSEFDGQRVADLLGTDKITVSDLYVRFCNLYRKFNLRVYHLSEDKTDINPWYYTSRRNVENAYELKDNLVGSKHNVLRYTKESIDVYAVVTYDKYAVCFKIDDYLFCVTSEFQKRVYVDSENGIIGFMPQELYDKLLVGNEQYAAFHELCDFSTESSELVRLLKELVANADNDNTVTE
ncbi:MAG: hypothetical protein IKM32_00150 [Clostridia bacterium]|nr:hypothetical protein [Clostridia bacterium]